MKWIVTGLLIVLCGIRCGLYYASRTSYGEGQRLRIQTRVQDVYTDSQFKNYFYVRTLKISVPLDLEITPGDTVFVEGVVQDERLQVNTFRVVRHGVLGPMYSVRGYLLNRLLRAVPGDEGALFAGLLVGGNTGMTREMRETFRTVGLTHLVAASGYNLSVVAAITHVLFQTLLGRRKSVIVILACVVLYAGIAGFGAPIVRAAIMTSLVFIGMLVGRRSVGLWLLFLSVVIMVFYDPRYLVDISFQLSGAATLGVILAGRYTGQLAAWKKELATGIWASVTTLPILLVQFGTFAWISILLTPLVTLVVPIIMQIGLVSIAVMPVGLEAVTAVAAWPLLRCITALIQITARLPIPSIGISITWPVVIVFYGGLAGYVVWQDKRHS